MWACKDEEKEWILADEGRLFMWAVSDAHHHRLINIQVECAINVYYELEIAANCCHTNDVTTHGHTVVALFLN